MKRPTMIPMLAILILGCQGVTDAIPSAQASAAGGNSSCVTVRFSTQMAGAGGVWTGTITGDLEGTVDVVFAPGTQFHPGNGGITMVGGESTWHVTGGVAGWLVGHSFSTVKVNRTIFPAGPGLDLIFGVNGTERAQSGVEQANLTYRGTLDVSDLTPPFDANYQWNGVICASS